MSKCHGSNISIFHVNIRKFSKHRGERLACLTSLQNDFDVIVLSEIESDASFYFSSILREYACVYKLPKGNTYGGVAEREDLKQLKDMHVLQMQFWKHLGRCWNV